MAPTQAAVYEGGREGDRRDSVPGHRHPERRGCPTERWRGRIPRQAPLPVAPWPRAHPRPPTTQRACAEQGVGALEQVAARPGALLLHDAVQKEQPRWLQRMQHAAHDQKTPWPLLRRLCHSLPSRACMTESHCISLDATALLCMEETALGAVAEACAAVFGLDGTGIDK